MVVSLLELRVLQVLTRAPSFFSLKSDLDLWIIDSVSRKEMCESPSIDKICLWTLYLVLSSWKAQGRNAEPKAVSPSWGCATDLNETHNSLFPLNRVAALLNVCSCHRPRAVCPTRAQLVSVLHPSHQDLGQSWPHQLLSPPALLMQLVRTLLTAKCLFLQLWPWCLSYYNGVSSFQINLFLL